MHTRIQQAAVLFSLLLTVQVASAQSLDIPEHGIRVTLPAGWERMEALSGNTILKLARTDTPGKEARIAIVTFLKDKPANLSAFTRDDQILALESGSILGEKVSVFALGRTQLASIFALWGKTYRNLPSRGPAYEYVYDFEREYRGVPKSFTIRLTSYGDEKWFESNSGEFDRFIQSISFSHRPNNSTHATPQAVRRTNSVPMHNDPAGARSARREIGDVESFLRSLFLGYGETFLSIALASIVVGIGKWLHSKTQHAPESQSTGA